MIAVGQHMDLTTRCLKHRRWFVHLRKEAECNHAKYWLVRRTEAGCNNAKDGLVHRRTEARLPSCEFKTNKDSMDSKGFCGLQNMSHGFRGMFSNVCQWVTKVGWGIPHRLRIDSGTNM